MRDLSSPMIAEITSNYIVPAILAAITFQTSTEYVWSGYGNLAWNGNVFKGIGTYGKMGDISEGTEVRAEGTSVTLSAIDQTALGNALSEIQIGAAATLWLALFAGNMQIVDSPYSIFSGVVDKPAINIDPEKDCSITLALESLMLNGQRATNRRYTTNDQHMTYPDDTGFNWVEILNDIALRWGG